MEATAQAKVDLRQRMQTLLEELTPAQVTQNSAAIWERLSVMPAMADATWLMIYVSKGHEVDTHGLIRQLLALGKRVCVPKFDEAAQSYITSELRDFDSELVEGKFKILEPKWDAVRRVDAGELDALVGPGLAFDTHGNRLGRGMGFFDAILQGARGTKIALAHDFQVLNEVPAEPHDVGMNFIVTEKRVVECKRN
jgi:5-formyltetrahydrofolate cyclo-ligase